MGSRLANPFSFSDVDVGDAFQFINHIVREGPTSRSGVGDKGLAFQTIGRGFAPRQPYLFFRRRRRRRVSIYQSYYGREGPTGRSGVGDKALAFQTIGRGFAPRQPFLFFTRRRRRSVSIYYKAYYGREETKYNRSEW